MPCLRWIPLLLALLVPAQGAGPVPDPPGRFPFMTYGMAQGLTSLSILDLVQDRSGCLWVATDNGLFRFDGRTFTPFGGREGMSSTYVSALALSPEGEVLVGTYRGLARVVGNRVVAYPASSGLPPVQIFKVAFDAQGRAVVATEQGVFRSLGASSFELLPGWPGGRATALWVDALDGRIWAGREDTLAEWTPDGRWRFYGTAEGLGTSCIHAILRDDEGRLWVRSLGGLWMRPRSGGAFQDRTLWLPGPSVMATLAQHPDGGLLVPGGQGLAHIRGDKVECLDRSRGVGFEGVMALLVDREGSLWLGGVGLHRLRGRAQWMTFGTEEGMPGDAAWSIHRDGKGRLWVGTGRGLAQVTPHGMRLVQGTGNRIVRQVLEGPDGGLWLATGPAATVLRVDPGSLAVRAFGREAGLQGSRALCLAFDREGTHWVGTSDAGLFRRPRQGGAWVREELPRGTRTERIARVLEDAKGRLWVCGEHGLAIREQGRWSRFTEADGLKDPHLMTLLLRGGGEAWVSYFEPVGITRLRYEAGRIEILGHHSGTIHQGNPTRIFTLGEDSQGVVWAGTGKGMDRYHPDGHTDHLDVSDGLAGHDICALGFLAEPLGPVWIGTATGLSRFLPGRNLPPPASRPPVILKAQADGREWPARGEVVASSSGRVNLVLDFAAPTFLRQEYLAFQVRLLGLEEDWRDVAATTLTYGALPPGAYTFEVRSRDGEGPWTEPGRLSFRVAPRWWQALWFRGLVGGALILGAALLLRTRFREVLSLNRRLTKAVEDRTAELQIAMARLQEAHLLDDLTGLRNRRYADQYLAQDVAHALRHRQEGSDSALPNQDLVFYLVDLDYFQRLNDRYGTGAGDQVLRAAAAVLQDCMRESDAILRWGGEEFLVIARGSSRREASRLAERIRCSLEAAVLGHHGHGALRSTASIGFVPFPLLPGNPDALSWERAVLAAEGCLALAKQQGRNAWVGAMPTRTTTEALLGDLGPHALEALAQEGRLELVTSASGEPVNPR